MEVESEQGVKSIDDNPYKYTFDMINMILPPDHKVRVSYEHILINEYNNILDEVRIRRNSITVKESKMLIDKISIMMKILVHCLYNHYKDVHVMISKGNDDMRILTDAMKKILNNK